MACVMDEDGKILYETTYHNTHASAAEFAKKIREEYGKCTAACKSAGNMWTKTYYAMQDGNIPIILANPHKIPPTSKPATKTDGIDARVLVTDDPRQGAPAQGKKTDGIDARVLVTLLRLDAIQACHVHSREKQELIAMLRHRTTIVQDRARVIDRLYRLLDMHDLDIHQDKSRNVENSKFLDWLKGQPLGRDAEILRQYTRQIRLLSEDEKEANMRIVKEAGSDGNARLIMSIPGFDYFDALLISTEIGDIKRFTAASKLVSWAGLSPGAQASTDTGHSRMKKYANQKVNWTVIQVARIAMQDDDRLKRYYENVRKRYSQAVAITRVGNKIVTIIWHMLTTQTPYGHNEDPYEDKHKRMGSM